MNLFAKISLDSKEFDSGVDKARSSFSSLADGAKSTIDGINNVGQKVTGVLTGVITAAGAAIMGLGKIGIDYNSEMENYTTNFKVMLGSTEAAVAKVTELKKMAAATPFAMGDLADGTQTLLAFGVANDKSTGILKQLGDVSLGNAEKFKTLTNAFGKANAAGKMTGETYQQMIGVGFNPLDIISKKTGESMTELQKRMSDGKVSAEELAGALEVATSAGGQFYNGMQEASKTLSGLMSTLEDNARSLVGSVFKPISDMLVSTIIPKAIEMVDRMQVAFDTGGIKGLVSEAGSVFGDILTEVGQALPKVAEMAVSLVTSFITAIGNNKNGLLEVGRNLITTLADGIRSIMGSLGEIVPEFIPMILNGIITYKTMVFEVGVQFIGMLVEGIIKGLPSMAQTFGDAFLKIAQAASGALAGIGDALTESMTMSNDWVDLALSSVLEGLQTLAAGISENLPTIITGLTDMFGKILEMVVLYLPDLMTAGVSIFTSLLTAISGALPTLIPQLVSAALSMLQAIVTGLTTNIPLIIDAALQLIMGLVEGLIAAIPLIVEAVPQIIDALYDGVIAALPLIIEAGISLFTALIDALPKIITQIVSALPKIIDSVIEYVLSAIPMLIDAGLKLLVSLVGALPEIITAIVAAIPEIITGLTEGILGNIDKIILAGVQLIVSLVENIPAIIIGLAKAVPDIIIGLVKAFTSSDSLKKMSNIGLDLIKGIWNGISDAASWLWEKVSGFFTELTDKIKDFFGIHSPSTVFAGYGDNMSKGLGLGFTKSMKRVSEDMKNAIPTDFNLGIGVTRNVKTIGISSAALHNTISAGTAAAGGNGGIHFEINNPKFMRPDDMDEYMDLAVARLKQLGVALV